MSHPARGAWIEMGTVSHLCRRWTRRTPQGVRGLKYDALFIADLLYGRTPQGVRGLKCKSPCRSRARLRRTPQGVRGLK